MANGSGGGAIFQAFKFLFGDVPAQWVRLFLFGAIAAYCLIKAGTFASDMRKESAAVRLVLTDYIASNKAWQDASVKERRRLVGQFNRRVEKVTRKLGMEYDWIEVDQ